MRGSAARKLMDWWAHAGKVCIEPGDITPLLAVAGVSASTLRKHLRESGLPLHPLVEGVRQESLDELERTLVALAAVYEAGEEKAAREAVLTAKEHARWAERKHPAAERREGMQWMLVWLENPPAFAAWARLRRQAMAAAATESRSTEPE